MKIKSAGRLTKSRPAVPCIFAELPIDRRRQINDRFFEAKIPQEQ
jgi:hypothetical protein